MTANRFRAASALVALFMMVALLVVAWAQR
jgi:hypothetical protein